MEQLINVKVAKKKVEAIDICSFELVHPTGGELPGFTAGSHMGPASGSRRRGASSGTAT